jgi:solute carrier family 45 protein 1/2/4
MFSQLIYCVGMIVLAITKSTFVAGLTSLSAGIMYSSLFTIPFILVANYHSQDSSVK